MINRKFIQILSCTILCLFAAPAFAQAPTILQVADRTSVDGGATKHQSRLAKSDGQGDYMEEANMSASEQTSDSTPLITGIGGLFFRSENPEVLRDWYAELLGIAPPPTSYDQEPWMQSAGPTVFAPFEHDTDYFGDPSNQFMVNFRVRDLDAMAEVLRARGVEVAIDPQQYPNGRFARIYDPEGNAIELWEPASSSDE